ncbi:M23 family metallopeptidase [Nocardia sp. NPDC004068]|uniref:M23 family metallopeptidase n=1 Tax=Nocardia sp. NPDC004068 TaxID=3364303 RepID=UPI00367C33BB
MPVTVSLPTRRARRAAQAVAMTAVVGASIATLGAADRHGSGSAPGLAAVARSLETAPAAPAPLAVEPVVARPQPAPADDGPWLEAKAAREIKRTVRPVAGVLTSGFGMRWGALHGGIDFGDPIGTPIAAVTDGVVVEAGPASGFGMWVRVRQDDGTIGVYGHVNDILATLGQQVRAGDIIATVGNRGFSTGPHLHYEVWADEGGAKLDPLPWLLARGLELGRPQD